MFVDRDIDVALRQTKIDVAFLAVRGRYSADGCLQGLLELHGIPYTGSGVLACGLAMNRAKTKDVLRLFNLPVAPGYVLRSDHDETLRRCTNRSDSRRWSVPSARRCYGGAPWRATSWSWKARWRTCFGWRIRPWSSDSCRAVRSRSGILDGVALGIVEVPRVASWAGLRSVGRAVRKLCTPIRLSRERHDSVLRLATQAYDALGCEGPACVEMLGQRTTQRDHRRHRHLAPALPTSPLPVIARQRGLDYGELRRRDSNVAHPGWR